MVVRMGKDGFKRMTEFLVSVLPRQQKTFRLFVPQSMD